MFGKIVLDHRAYFYKFCEEHGGDPVEHEGRLLFRDGWTYSNIDYAGPEWPPPPDQNEVRRLKFAYWRQFKALAVRQLGYLSRIAGDLGRLQASKSAPLMRRVPPVENGQPWGSETLDLKELQERREWLELARNLAEAEIDALESGA